MVTLYSKNYKGDTPRPKAGKSLCTQFHIDKDDTERELKILAALEGSACVVNVEYSREKREEGNYKYGVWQARGIA